MTTEPHLISDDGRERFFWNIGHDLDGQEDSELKCKPMVDRWLWRRRPRLVWEGGKAEDSGLV